MPPTQRKASEPKSPEDRLREPFPAEQIGKLPRVTCKACRDASNKVCNEHSKKRCDVCRNFISTAHMHLDYVGHAAVTARLLEVDPQWNWEPLAFDERGLPALDGANGLWIKLTVLGVTRLGYGTSERRDLDMVKILISDALRNGAMRFGVALDLWSKEDLHQDEPGESPAPASTPDEPQEPPRDWLAEAAKLTTEAELLDLGRACNQAGQFKGSVKTGLLKRRQELQQLAAEAAAAQEPEALDG